MKHAFTMLELVFVIVLIGIISVLAIPRFDDNNLRQAADQIVGHIRYTQHLAMMDDKFDAGDNTWYRERWQIKFNNTNGSGNVWAYSIYRDTDQDGAGDTAEYAINPLDQTKRLTGGWATILVGNAQITENLRIGNEFGINGVTFTLGCAGNNNQLWLSFDNLGRPLFRDAQNLTTPYEENLANRLVVTQCVITLTDANGANVQIAIEPETGYTHILN
jgi:prepilin-type N-terminal cleavage/methylation domain-containing protein